MNNLLTNKYLISILPLILVILFFLSLFLFFALLIYPKKQRDNDVINRMHSSFLNVLMREFWYWIIDPVVNIFIKLTITPNIITGLSLILSAISAFFYYKGEFSIAGWLLVVGGSMDMIDGRVARLTNTESKAGAYWDSCADRYSEGIVFLAISLYYYNNFIPLTASILSLLGSEMVSYTKARGEAVGFSTKRGLMQRPERLFILCFVSVLQPLFEVIFVSNPEIIFIGAIIFIAITTNITAIVRLISIFNNIKNTESGKS